MKLCLLLTAAAVICHAQVRRIDPPAAPASGMPYLATTPDGAIHLAWTDTLADREHALRRSRWTGASWTAPETIVRGRNWFVNWADFASLTVLGDRSMLAHWLTKSDGAGAYGYGIRVTRKAPTGSAWRAIHGINLDDTADYAGFLTFVPGEASAIYLAPPAGAHEGHRKTVRFVAFRRDGSVESDVEIDPDACSCCQTAIGRTRSGLIAAYRDHLPGEIRDIAVVRQVNGRWTAPRTLHADGWQINGCPTDGPSIATRDSRVAVAWLTRAGGQARIQAAVSHDDGATFSTPVRLDSGNPLGRPNIVADDTGYLAVWLEKTAGEKVEVRLRRLAQDGSMGTPLTVTQAPPARGAGFPKIAVSGKQILVVWRDEQVRAALLSPSQLNGTKPR